jgi:hypothetical protein
MKRRVFVTGVAGLLAAPLASAAAEIVSLETIGGARR